MTDLPGWIQEIRDRADKATPGPWEAVTYASVVVGPTCDMPDNSNACFLANARTDVPRLIELVGEMAGALEAALEHLSLGQYVQSPGKCRVCGGYVHTKCLTICEQCAARMVREALDKYRGEVSDND